MKHPSRSLALLFLALSTAAACSQVAHDQRIGSEPAPAPTQSAARPTRSSIPPGSYVATLPGHPRIRTTGVVDSFDPTTGILGFRDGRIVQLTADSTITLPAEAPRRLEPGQTVTVDSVLPLGVRNAAGLPALAGDQFMGYQRMGTVESVAKNVVRLTDGAAIQLSPTARVHMGVDGADVTLNDVRPGDEVVIVVSDPSAADVTEVMVFRPMASSGR